MSDPQPRRPRHLLDPDNPRPQRPAQQQGMSITQVQKWVMSVLAFVTIEHLAGGIAVVAILTDPRHVGDRVVLNVLAAVTGVLAVALARAIHAKPVLSPWLLVGLLPGLVGAWLSFAR
jgi:hypothetical protein